MSGSSRSFFPKRRFYKITAQKNAHPKQAKFAIIPT